MNVAQYLIAQIQGQNSAALKQISHVLVVSRIQTVVIRAKFVAPSPGSTRIEKVASRVLLRRPEFRQMMRFYHRVQVVRIGSALTIT